jgi:hypothetical protein
LKNWHFKQSLGSTQWYKNKHKNLYSYVNQTEPSEDTTDANSKEDSQADGSFTDDKDIMFLEGF